MTATDPRVLDEDCVELPAALESGVLTAVSRAELDTQITTARAYPRSLKAFRTECLNMATITVDVAEECIYALPRGGKTIEGPSARLAEIVASSWGNCRVGARVVDEGAEFITSQGVFHDLQKNVQVTMEVRRRITGRNGRRYDADMIAVTGNAACSIAMRNAVFRAVPKALWTDIYEEVRRTIVGDNEPLANSRAKALAYLQKFGATEAAVLARLGVADVEEIGRDQIVTLRGLANAIRDSETTVEAAFPEPSAEGAEQPAKNPGPKKGGKGVAGLEGRLGGDEPAAGGEEVAS